MLLLSLPDARRWHAIPALLLTGKLVCLLAVLLVFAPRALYGTAHAHGVSALDDQHLAGLLMIAACPLSYLVAAIMITVALVYRDHAATRCGSRCEARVDAPRSARRNPAHDPAWRSTPSRALAARLSVPVVRRLHGRGQPRPLGRHRMAADLRDAQLGQDPCLRHRAAAVLDHPDLVSLGAGHFHGGCAFCHGAPGVPTGPVARQHAAAAADLATQMRLVARPRAVLDRQARHQIHRHAGLGRAAARDDEVWALVAFLRRLPALDADGYRALALGDLAIRRESGREVATTETARRAPARAVTATSGNAPPSALVPILHGQPVEFSLRALQPMRERRRASGIMQPVAVDLEPEERDRVARYYAGLRPPARPLSILPGATAAIARGRMLAEQGDASAGFRPAPVATAPTR